MPAVRVASFNAHWCLHRHGGPVDLAAAVCDLDPDVLCVQEAWRPRDRPAMHETVARDLGYELVEMRVPRHHNNTAPHLVRAVDGPLSWWGMALLTRFPVTAMVEHELGEVVGDEADRIAVRFVLDVNGHPLVVTCTHLTWRAWGIPKQLWRLRKVLGPGTEPGFAAGDFNMWGPIVQGALPGWRRAVLGRTWPAPRVWHQLDHILVNREVTVVDSEVGDYYGSDHRPVRATLQF